MRRNFWVGVAVVVAACGGASNSSDDFALTGDDKLDELGQAFSSARAQLLNFEFDGELVAGASTTSANARTAINDQMLFTIGHLNGNQAVGRLDKLKLSSIVVTSAGTAKRVTYHAVLPVSWGVKASFPSSYVFTLPKAVDLASRDAFTNRYKAGCVDATGAEANTGNMWYHFRPGNAACDLAAADVVSLNVSITRSLENSTGKYPEFHKVWEDNTLQVISIFGKVTEGTTTGDDGITAYNQFVSSVRLLFADMSLKTTPSVVPTLPGVAMPDITLEATLPSGQTVKVTALLVDNIRTVSAAFDARYASLSTRADLITYNGHAGLGANVRALATKGKFVKGQYTVFFMNGCDTFAYVDGSLAQTRAKLNPDDPTGTKYMEFVTNSMPAFFNNMATASMALIGALAKPETPLTYEQIFSKVDSSQVVVVTGEEDNLYFPGYPGGSRDYLRDERGFVAQNEELRYETPVLAAGVVTVQLSYDPSQPGGDADIYVRAGGVADANTYDCRPFESGSEERCELTLETPSKVYISVKGYSAQQQNHFVLTVRGVSAGGPSWEGLSADGTVAKSALKRYATAQLPAGKYVFDLSGSGDADLYVRAGVAPTTTDYDCRPYQSTSNEQCVLSLSAPAVVHLMVRGYAASSNFHLAGHQ